MVDPKLLSILRCPITKQSLRVLTDDELRLVNEAIQKDQLVYADGSKIDKSYDQALITENNKTIYRIEDGIPVMLEDLSVAAETVVGLR